MTLARRLLNEAIDAHQSLMAGQVLDIGGERVNTIASFEKPQLDWIYFNLEQRYAPDVIGNCEALPFKAESIGTVLLFEILEHVPDPRMVLDEAKRVLRPGGRLFVSMPFMYRHHRNPADFHRWTHERFFMELEDRLGMQIDVLVPRGAWLATVLDILTQGLGGVVPGTFRGSSVLSFLGRVFSRLISLSYPMWRKWDLWLADVSRTKAIFHRYTTGYLVVARKPREDEGWRGTPEKSRDALRTPLSPLL